LRAGIVKASFDAQTIRAWRNVGREFASRSQQEPEEETMSRALPGVLGALFLAATTGLSVAQVSDGVVKLGVLTDMSGPAQDATGPGSVLAAQMAVEDFGGKVLDKPIEVIAADHQDKADVGSTIARQWYDVEKVDLILDVPVSAVGLAVQAVSREKQKLLIVHSTGTADFTGKFCTPYSMQWAFNTVALAVGTAREVVKRGGDSWFFLTADYAFGHSLERDASRVIVESGGKVVGAVRHPFATPDLSSFIVQAQASKAKIIGLAAGPPDNTNAIKLGGEFGVFQGGQQMAGLLVLITDVNALGLKAAQGLVLTTSFYWDTDEPTRAWSKRFFAKLNKMPTMWQAGVYSSVMHYLNAVKAAGTDDPLKVAAKMREMPVEDFFSRHGRLREDGLMVHDLLLVQVKKPEDSKYPWDYYQVLTTIPGDQAFQPPDPACSLVKK
jgi:branched-chain amino acid transport system substrate-binding protein